MNGNVHVDVVIRLITASRYLLCDSTEMSECAASRAEHSRACRGGGSRERDAHKARSAERRGAPVGRDGRAAAAGGRGAGRAAAASSVVAHSSRLTKQGTCAGSHDGELRTRSGEARTGRYSCDTTKNHYCILMRNTPPLRTETNSP